MDVAAFARGFLALVGASNRGVGVRQASDALVPTVDLEPLLGLNHRAYTATVTNPLLTGDTNVMTVPAGFQWKIKAGGLVLEHPAGATVTQAFLYIRPPQNTNGYVPVSVPISLTGAGIEDGVSLFSPVDLVLASGTVIGVTATVGGAGAVISTITFLIEQLDS